MHIIQRFAQFESNCDNSFSRKRLIVVSGAIFVEKIFGWHGMGEWAFLGISQQDTNVVAAITLFSASVILLAGLLSDVFYAVLDPRVRVT